MHTTYHLYDKDHLVAYINIFPFTHDAIKDFKNGTRGWILGIDRLEQFEPGKPLECIIIDLVLFQETSWGKREKWGHPTPRQGRTPAPLFPNHSFDSALENFSRTLTEWGEKGIEISKVYAASNTEQGIRIIKHAGFQTIKEVGPGRYTFDSVIIVNCSQLSPKSQVF